MVLNTYFVIDQDNSVNDKLKSVSDDFSNFVSLGSASTYETAMNTILKRKPDIVFFNLDNVLSNSFEFVTELKNYLDNVPDFIAVSSTIDHAYMALKHNFIDYLLRPFSELEMRKIFMKFKKKQQVDTNKTLCLQSYKDFRYLDTDKVLFLKADNNTTDIYLIDGSTFSAFKTLKIFENHLPSNFLRIHKSYIVNKDYVSRINFGKQKCTVINSNFNIPFTKTYIDNIEFIKTSISDISISNLN